MVISKTTGRNWLLLTTVCLALFAVAADTPQAGVYDDPAKVDADYAFQGEYSGSIGDEKNKYGVQVIALGDGKFRAVAYIGGLPGDGWKKLEKIEVDGELKNGSVEFVSAAGKAVLNGNDSLTLFDGTGNGVGSLDKVKRESPTAGAKPPEGAVVLFDGKSADQFEGGRLTDDHLLMEGVNSKQKFGSCKLHVEFRLPYMPKATGQGRGNSGCYLQSRYEVQILDSFGLAGKNNECGGIYSIKDPDQNMCFPPLTWQTYDIDYTAAKFGADGKKSENARITVKQNGVLIHDNVELEHATTAAPLKEGAEPGPLHLQNHGNPVRFRNIWIAETR
jgi:hypothetical protein